jgi:hypothetical protein
MGVNGQCHALAALYSRERNYCQKRIGERRCSFMHFNVDTRCSWQSQVKQLILWHPDVLNILKLVYFLLSLFTRLLFHILSRRTTCFGRTRLSSGSLCVIVHKSLHFYANIHYCHLLKLLNLLNCAKNEVICL